MSRHNESGSRLPAVPKPLPVDEPALAEVAHRGHFPNEQAAMKVLYLIAIRRQKNRENMTGQIAGWKQILNALTIHYGDRIGPTTK